MEIRRGTQTQIFEYARRGRSVERVGATNDPRRRKAEYENGDFRNQDVSRYTFLHSRTQNMKERETELIQVCKESGACNRNLQEVSNMEPRPGQIYAIIETAVLKYKIHS